MRSPILWLACSAVMLTPFVASAQTQQAATAQPAAMAQPVADVSDSNRVICHMIVHEGMLVRTNQCHTQHEWDAIRRNGQQDLQEFQQRSLMKN
jgi:hypothetical protein